ncbi:MAG: hypothetical protein A3J74_11570 [Elusimicrobia bacterium RIFCSPHIGHO2_02_FULL_57_9]|nr:MAG: hypothetical protein A3J74_11570 [Elusimicrobia bacterium RIFCSPHIGHO2_02_FULL_57_9]
MSEETVYVDCPCCGARLEARRQDGRVLQHWKKPLKAQADGADPIKAAQERMKAEKEKLAKLLENPTKLIEEQRRAALEKFEKEKERIIREKDNSAPPHPFDSD